MRTLKTAILASIIIGGIGYFTGDHPQQQRVFDAAEACRSKLGHALGKEWMGCVVETLLAEQEAAKAEGRSDYFPVVPHELQPLRPVAGTSFSDPGYQQAELLKDLMRNFTCDVADGGSAPVRSVSWEYQPPDPCAATAGTFRLGGVGGSGILNIRSIQA